jgi:hypothetical protein
LRSDRQLPTVQACITRVLAARDAHPIAVKSGATVELQLLKRLPGTEVTKLTDAPPPEGGWAEGLRVVKFQLSPQGTASTIIEISARILVRPNVDPTGGRSLGPARPPLWRPLLSNGTIEREWTQVIEEECCHQP